MLHFVGFKDDRYLTALKYFGQPDFVHRFWDSRARAEIVEGDVTIFADKDETKPLSQYSYDDSSFF